MAIRASNKITASWFEPAGQDDATVKTRFFVKPLTGAQYLKVIETLHTASQTDGQLMALRYALVDWQDFMDDAGAVKFQTGDMNENISRLPWQIISALSKHILEISDIGSAERKN